MEEERRSNEHIIPLDIYTDGSLKKIGSTAFGGWAYIVTQDGKEVCWAAGGENCTTNQRMELKAILEGLKYAKFNRRPNERVTIYSDSAYAINCYRQQWYVNWQSNGWRNANKQSVANQDLWIQIIPFFENFWYDFCKVEGHAGIFWNEECDKHAQYEAEQLKHKWRGKNV